MRFYADHSIDDRLRWRSRIILHIITAMRDVISVMEEFEIITTITR